MQGLLEALIIRTREPLLNLFAYRGIQNGNCIVMDTMGPKLTFMAQNMRLLLLQVILKQLMSTMFRALFVLFAKEELLTCFQVSMTNEEYIKMYVLRVYLFFICKYILFCDMFFSHKIKIYVLISYILDKRNKSRK